MKNNQVELLEAISANIEVWFEREQTEYQETVDIDNSKRI